MKPNLLFLLLFLAQILSAQIFTEVLPRIPFEDVLGGTLTFSDVDGDRDEDVLITGRNSLAGPFVNLYINETVVSSNNVHWEGIYFMAFPNPASNGKVNLSIYQGWSGLFDILVFDASGRFLQQQREALHLGENLISLDLTKIQKGVYFIHVRNGKWTATKKVLIP